jgi:hypothetical protein
VTGNHANGKAAPAFDLEAAAAAAEAESASVPFPFTYKGRHYKLPPSSRWELSTLRAVAAGDLEIALGELIGPESYDKLCDAGLTVGELSALFTQVGVAAVGSLPNSRPPQRRVSTRT